MQDNTTTISRRSVATGLAWSVPAVAAVTAAPAYAASPKCVTATRKDVVKYPGNSSGHGLKQAYGFEVTVVNSAENNLRVDAKSVSVKLDKKVLRGALQIYSADPCLGGKLLTPSSSLLELAPGKSVTLWLVANNTGSSANDSGCISATLGVTLLDEKPVGDLCNEYTVDDICFDAVTPTAAC